MFAWRSLGSAGPSRWRTAFEALHEIRPGRELLRQGAARGREARARAVQQARHDDQRVLLLAVGEGALMPVSISNTIAAYEKTSVRGFDAAVALLELLRGRVAEARSGERRRLAEPHVDELHQAEVRHLGRLDPPRRSREQHVRRLEVPVHDLVCVHVLQRERHLPGDATRALEGQAGPAALRQHLLQRRPSHVLEHREPQLDRRPARGARQGRRPGVEAPHDVRVGPRRLPRYVKHLGLALEAGERLGARGVRPQHLHDDEVARRLVPRGREDPALAAFTHALAHVVADPPGARAGPARARGPGGPAGAGRPRSSPPHPSAATRHPEA